MEFFSLCCVAALCRLRLRSWIKRIDDEVVVRLVAELFTEFFATNHPSEAAIWVALSLDYLPAQVAIVDHCFAGRGLQ